MKKIILPILIGAIGVTFAIADSDKESNIYAKKTLTKQNAKLEPLYKKECSECHMAYQPEFLPKRSWKKIMATLSDHFGTDATIDNADSKKILKYLSSNAADSKRVYGDFRKFLKSIPKDKTVMKISEIPYFKKEHREIPKKFIAQKEVKSFSNCKACHQKADSGDYSERDINIPNYGRWDD